MQSCTAVPQFSRKFQKPNWWCSWYQLCDTHDYCNSLRTKIAEQLKLFAQHFEKLRGKECPNLAKKCLFVFKFLETLLFGRVSIVQKLFNDYISYTSIGTQLRARSLKISSHSDHICWSKGVSVPKNGQNFGYT